MIIKNADLADIPIIQQLAFEIWPVAYGDILSVEQLQYMLNNMYSASSLHSQMSELHHQFLLALDEGLPIAFASYSNISTSSEERKFKLHKLYVLLKDQGRGIGKLLVEEISQQIKSSQITKLMLNVNRHNNAVEFYKRLGFRVIREEDIDIGDGFYMNDYVMEKIIETN